MHLSAHQCDVRRRKHTMKFDADTPTSIKGPVHYVSYAAFKCVASLSFLCTGQGLCFNSLNIYFVYIFISS